jgi:hypothetical protein
MTLLVAAFTGTEADIVKALDIVLYRQRRIHAAYRCRKKRQLYAQELLDSLKSS